MAACRRKVDLIFLRPPKLRPDFWLCIDSSLLRPVELVPLEPRVIFGTPFSRFSELLSMDCVNLTAGGSEKVLTEPVKR